MLNKIKVQKNIYSIVSLYKEYSKVINCLGVQPMWYNPKEEKEN